MTLFPIVLGVRSSSDAEILSHAPATKPAAEKVLRRDGCVCRFCGFKSEKFQRVIPYAAAGEIPFATVCTFCEQCLFLERNGITGAGLLIWLPEIPQAELNHIARAAYIARQENPPNETLGPSATRAIDSLTARRAEAKKRLGIDDPILLATILHESLTDGERKEAVQKLDGIRLLPSDKYWIRGASGDVNQFSTMAKYWRSSEGPYAKTPVTSWSDMFKMATTAAGHA